MCPFSELTVVRRAAGAFASSLLAFCAAGAHAQATNWQSTVPACVAANPDTFNNTTIVMPGNYVRAPTFAGPNPPTYSWICNVLDPYNTTQPIWNWMQLEFASPLANSVTAQLFSKNKVTGAINLVSTVNNFPSAAVNVAQVGLPPLGVIDFLNNGYYIVVSVRPQQNFRVQAHMVTLAE